MHERLLYKIFPIHWDDNSFAMTKYISNRHLICMLHLQIERFQWICFSVVSVRFHEYLLRTIAMSQNEMLLSYHIGISMAITMIFIIQYHFIIVSRSAYLSNHSHFRRNLFLQIIPNSWRKFVEWFRFLDDKESHKRLTGKH